MAEQTVDLQKLIDEVKQQGIEEARIAADKILAEAQQKAEKIVTDAEREATAKVDDAKTKAEQFKESARDEIRIACREALGLLKEQIVALFTQALSQQSGVDLTRIPYVKEVIFALVENWVDGNQVEIAIGSTIDMTDLVSRLQESLGERLGTEIIIKVDPHYRNGFTLRRQDEELVHEFTDTAIVEVLSPFLRPAVLQLMEEARE